MQLCCESINGSCIKSSWSISIQMSMYVSMLCVILGTVAGNLTVIISIAHFRQLHTPTNFLILSMATVDFLLGVLVMPYSMVRSVENCWYFGEFFCKVHTSVDIMLSTASIFHLSFISIDRYYAICDPLRYKAKINTYVILIMIFVSWMLPALFGFGMIFLQLNMTGAKETFYKFIYCVGGCFVFFDETSGVVASMVCFYIPGFVMVYIYGKIYTIAKRQARSIKAVMSQAQIRFQMKHHISRSRERKAAKTLGIVVGVFLTCWFPFFFCTATDPFMNYTIPPIVIDAMVWLGYMNSTFNPIVYAYFYLWFRRALKMIVLGKVFQQNSSRIKLFWE
uniref:Trace amine-associated receptor 1 n=1 Tax=Anolis carolinensis TaxID=28377 RepID=H9GGI9_ANOCA|nr:PREDICTED: trace amine-associated receptor 1 [Anolis carolinensis]XP_008112773.1 PREDICTED: trace amine-associated receptor 1 [Anolis carolinensis]|eukprot:XP_003223362.1 PREDICTED: trace amine-associated receptor 1 [Anolis carolinensis]